MTYYAVDKYTAEELAQKLVGHPKLCLGWETVATLGLHYDAEREVGR